MRITPPATSTTTARPSRSARALIWGQHPSGGWNYVVDFAGDRSLRDWYATVGKNAWRLEEFQHYYGNATFDDQVTTDAATFLLRLYVEKLDARYKAPVDRAIQFVLDSQYPDRRLAAALPAEPRILEEGPGGLLLLSTRSTTTWPGRTSRS